MCEEKAEGRQDCESQLLELCPRTMSICLHTFQRKNYLSLTALRHLYPVVDVFDLVLAQSPTSVYIFNFPVVLLVTNGKGKLPGRC